MNMDVKSLIKEEIGLLLERRIAQVLNKLEVTFNFDLIKTKHAEQRKDFSKRGLTSFITTPITNAEMVEFVSSFKNDISEGIVLGDIHNNTEFVIKSLDKRLAMAIKAEQVSGVYWRLIIKTVFRESEFDSFRVRTNQLVYDK